jgi:hypothetical protein
MRMAFSLALVVTLSACASIDRNVTQFVPPEQPDGIFKFKAFADIVYPLDTEYGESTRMQWLGEWLRLNAQCPAGFSILSRTPVRRGGNPESSGAAFDVYYEGRCK